MTVYGSQTICSLSAHDVGTTTPTTGVTYNCRKCGAQVIFPKGPSGQVANYPGSGQTPAFTGS